MNFKPLANRIVALRFPEEEITKSGIIIAQTARTVSHKATVLAVGPGKYQNGKLIPIPVSVGDVILIGLSAGTKIKIEDQDVVIVTDDEIIGIVS